MKISKTKEKLNNILASIFTKSAIWVFIALGVSFSSCNSKGSKIKVGFLIRGFDIERCKKEKDFFIERMTQLGGETIITDANENDQLQIQQGIELLDKGVDVLVIFPVNLNTSAAIVREANNRNVKVIAYESLILNCKLDYYVSADNEKGGVMMAQHTLNLVPRGNYVLLGGNKADRNAVLIKNGQFQVINPSVKQGNIKVLYDIYNDWTADEGYQEISRVINLTGTFPDAILASNDGIAAGVIKALGEFGMDRKIPVTGLDGELSAFQRVAKGTQSMTVFKSFKIEAYSAAEIAFQLASGNKPDKLSKTVFNGSKDVPSYLIEPVLVDKNNIRQVLASSKVFTEKEVFEP
jgi:D-xylose transport system substrate-binding protein